MCPIRGGRAGSIVSTVRILMANALFPPDRTGSSVFTQQLSDALASMGHEIHVVTSSRVLDDATSDVPYEVTRLRARRVSVGKLAWNYSIPLNFTPGNYRRVRSLVKSFRPDVIVCHGQIFDLTWMLCVMARRLGIPTVVVVHTAVWNENPYRRAVLRTFERLVIRPLIRFARPSFVAVDKWTRDDARRTLAKGLPLQVIPVSADASQMVDGDAQAAREKYRLPDGPILLSLGHVISLRNRHALVRALPRILAEHPDLTVVIVGDVRDETFLEIARDFRVEDAIMCLGSVPHSDIKDLLAAAEIEMHDLQGWGLGITTMEAMCAGVPIVAWATDDNYPGLSLRSFEGLMLLDSAGPAELSAATLELLADPDRRAAAIAGQQRLVDEIFDPMAVARAYQTVLDRVVDGA